MERSGRDRISHSALAALAFFATALSLGGCASAPPGHTQLSWPVGATYTVREGDTISEIADDFDVPEETLIAYNRLPNPHWIYPGQVLRVPRASYVASRRQPARERTQPRNVPRPSPRHEPYRYAARRSAPPRYAAPLRFIWPVAGRVISPFGATPGGGRNDGINIAARVGEPVRAAASGVVLYAGDELKGYGNLVLIRHEDGYVTAYAHAESIAVNRGDHVRKGQVIGYAGATGDVVRPQLHFEIRHGVRPVDPKPLLVASN